MKNWWSDYVINQQRVKDSLSVDMLAEEAIRQQKAIRTAAGAVVMYTGKHTGRAADDKYVVESQYANDKIDWSNKVHRLGRNDFLAIRSEVIEDLSDSIVYTTERSACAHPDYALGVRLISTNPLHALFVHHMFREPVQRPPLGHFTVIHHPEPQIEVKEYGLRAPTAIIIDFENREVLVLGTSYAGEIKKSIFSILNVLLPDLGVLPMHTGCNVTQKGDSSLFFGLSGTGKTTLSTDEGTFLVGDDEHVLFPQGIFNIEGGCYAKTSGLSEKTEPQIFQAVNTKNTLLENVYLSGNVPQFSNNSITENGRASYPLSSISGALQEGVAGVPTNVFFLTADAFGVLPPLSKLSVEQTLYYFLLGYTAKVAGTELGMKGVSAAFSHCFGAPFMMRKPEVYANLLKSYRQKMNFNVWLVNTGWYGGEYGQGKRYELSFTRALIRAVQSGELANVETKIEPYFSLAIPVSIKGVDSERLFPSSAWKSEFDYKTHADKLRQLMDKKFLHFV